MSTEHAGKKEETPTPQNFMIFELEGAAVNGREHLFEAAKKVFADAGIKLADRVFARYCVHAAPPYVIEQLVAEQGAGKLNSDAAEKIIADYTARILKDKPKLHPLFVELLDEANSRGIKVTALSVLPEDIAREVLSKTGLAGKHVDLVSFPQNERHFPRTDCWLKVPRAASKSPRACIAVAGSHDSGKSALAAGMRCVVVPDQYTSFQDFSGADAVIESKEDLEVSALFDSLI